MNAPGHVSHVVVNHEPHYHIAVVMPGGQRESWLLPAKDAIRARFNAEANRSRLHFPQAPQHSPLWRRLLRKMRSLL